eukprot:3239890-Lingulodinium_polyedra.AAC.1
MVAALAATAEAPPGLRAPAVAPAAPQEATLETMAVEALAQVRALPSEFSDLVHAAVGDIWRRGP